MSAQINVFTLLILLHGCAGNFAHAASTVNPRTQTEINSRVISTKSKIEHIDDIVDVCNQAKISCGLEVEDHFLTTPVVLSSTHLALGQFFSELVAMEPHYVWEIDGSPHGLTLNLMPRAVRSDEVLDKEISVDMTSMNDSDGILKFISRKGNLHYHPAQSGQDDLFRLRNPTGERPNFERHSLRFLLERHAEVHGGTWVVAYRKDRGTLKWFPPRAGD